MDPKAPISDEKYEGPPKAVVALGKAKIAGYMVGVMGAVAGYFTANQFASKAGSKVDMAHNIGSRFGIELSEKTALRGGGAIAGWFSGQLLGTLIGVSLALPGAGRGRAQFDLIKGQRDDARAKLEVYQQESHPTAAREATPHNEISTVDLAHDAPQAAVDLGR